MSADLQTALCGEPTEAEEALLAAPHGPRRVALAVDNVFSQYAKEETEAVRSQYVDAARRAGANWMSLRVARHAGNCAIDSRPLLVGEGNPYGGDPENALLPEPPGCAGDRMRALVDLGPIEYYERFCRINLCWRDYSRPEARRTARWVLDRSSPTVLLGSRVMDAVRACLDAAGGDPARGLEPGFQLRAFGTAGCLPGGQPRFVCLPHPSGRNRVWNDPVSVTMAFRLLVESGCL